MNHKNINDFNEKKFYLQKMKGKDNFSFCVFSLNDINQYLKQKKAWIHRRKVLNSLCSRSCIVPFSNKCSSSRFGNICLFVCFCRHSHPFWYVSNASKSCLIQQIDYFSMGNLKKYTKLLLIFISEAIL